MPQQTESRKVAFKVALVRLGLTVSAFAADQGVSRTHLYAVLDDERTPGAGLSAAIDDVIARGDKAA